VFVPAVKAAIRTTLYIPVFLHKNGKSKDPELATPLMDFADFFKLTVQGK
jgi:hypothetical protein